jgi:hypothetical protein
MMFVLVVELSTELPRLEGRQDSRIDIQRTLLDERISDSDQPQRLTRLP